jgi:hypothetical protein
LLITSISIKLQMKPWPSSLYYRQREYNEEEPARTKKITPSISDLLKKLIVVLVKTCSVNSTIKIFSLSKFSQINPTRTEFNDENRKFFLAERTYVQEFVWDFSSVKPFLGLEFESSFRQLFILFYFKYSEHG